MNRHFLEKETNITKLKKNLMKKYLTLIVMREMQTKTLMIYLYSFNWQKLKRLIIPVVRGDASPHFYSNFR